MKNLNANLLVKVCFAAKLSSYLIVVLFFNLFLNTSNVFAQGGSLSGTYTIGSAYDYDTFSDAVTDLHTKGISGPITFQVSSGTYNERFVIKEVIGTSKNDTIKFISATGNAADVIIMNTASTAEDNYIVTLDSADYITFEKITFTSSGTTYCTIFDIKNEASHNNILDNILTGGAVTTTNYSASLIHCDQYSIGVNFNPDSILVSGNTFNNGGIGIYVHAYSTSGARIEKFDIINNTFNNQYYQSLYVRATMNSTIKRNNISANTSGSSFYGIHVSQGEKNYLVTHNTVNISSNGKARGIEIDNHHASGETESVLIANNMVSSVGTSDVYGIETYNCSDINFYYNSLITDGGTTNYTFFERSHYSNDGPVDIVNNIFINESGGYAFHVEQDEGNLDYIGTIDYNDYYTTGANLAFWGTTVAVDLNSLRVLNGQDANSVSKAVTFVSSTDLHLAGGSIGDTDLIGIPLAEVTDDIDNDIRNDSVPYMGADENTDNPLPVELTSFTATMENNTVALNWNTATETNNYGFDIERQDNEEDWHVISFVKGFGTSTTPQSYTFVDNSVRNSSYIYRLKQIDDDATFCHSRAIEISVNLLPDKYHLEQNFPNPFNPSTTILYSIEQLGFVQLTIYDEMGRLVCTLIHKNQSAGEHSIVWDGKDGIGNRVSSGAYFYSLKVGENTLISKRMMMVK